MELCLFSFPKSTRSSVHCSNHVMPHEWDEEISYLCSSSVWPHSFPLIDNWTFCCQSRKKHFGRQYLQKPVAAQGSGPDAWIIFTENLLHQCTSSSQDMENCTRFPTTSHPDYLKVISQSFFFFLGETKHNSCLGKGSLRILNVSSKIYMEL